MDFQKAQIGSSSPPFSGVLQTAHRKWDNRICSQVGLIPEPALLTTFLGARMLPGIFLEVKYSCVINSFLPDDSLAQMLSLSSIYAAPQSTPRPDWSSRHSPCEGALPGSSAVTVSASLGLGPGTHWQYSPRRRNSRSGVSCFHTLHLHSVSAANSHCFRATCCPALCLWDLLPPLLTQDPLMLCLKGTNRQSLMKERCPRGLLLCLGYCRPNGRAAGLERELSCSSVPVLSVDSQVVSQMTLAQSPEAVSVAYAAGEKPAGNVLGKRPADITAECTGGPRDGDRKNIGEGFPGPSVSSGLWASCAHFCDCTRSLPYRYTC